jgi:hypothetical protein
MVAASNSSEIITIARRFGGTNILTEGDALRYFASGSPINMAVNKNYPNVVTSGLTYLYDSSFVASYPTDGNGWYDLSGNNYLSTLVNGPTYSDSTLTFDGIDDYAEANATDVFTVIPSNFTFECWIKNPPATNQGGMFSNAGGGDGYRFGPGNNGVYYLIGPSYTESVINWTSGTLNASLWYHVVATWDRTSAYIVNTYLNGKYENYGTMPTTQTTSTTTAPGIVRSSCCGVYTGKLAVMKVYNRILTGAEILQNYNATKTRFGL